MHLHAITTTFDHFSTLDPYGLANLGDGTPGLYTEVHHRGTNPVSRRHPTSGFIDSSHKVYGLDFFVARPVFMACCKSLCETRHVSHRFSRWSFLFSLLYISSSVVRTLLQCLCFLPVLIRFTQCALERLFWFGICSLNILVHARDDMLRRDIRLVRDVLCFCFYTLVTVGNIRHLSGAAVCPNP